MAFLETKHTLSRLDKVKKDLHKSTLILSCISMILFLAFNIYLLIANINNIFYLVIYSVLILSIFSLFLVEILIKEDNYFHRKDKKQTKEKKIKTKNIIKVFKFSAKTILVVVAIFESITNFYVSLSNIFNIFSAAILIIQITFELIINYIVKQIDYFKLSFQLDINESSAIVHFFSNKFTEQQILEKKLQI